MIPLTMKPVCICVRAKVVMVVVLINSGPGHGGRRIHSSPCNPSIVSTRNCREGFKDGPLIFRLFLSNTINMACNMACVGVNASIIKFAHGFVANATLRRMVMHACPSLLAPRP